MKIVILSDTHDRTDNFRKALTWAQDNSVELVIHCGDVSRPSTLKECLSAFKGRFVMCLGNADVRTGWEGPVEAEYGELTVDGVDVAFTHFDDRAGRLAERGDYDIVFHGHTHKPWIRGVEGVQVVNPGNLAGFGYEPTFAFWDTEEGSFELKVLNEL